MYREFIEYVHSFNFYDRGINRKLYHSKRVALLCSHMAANLGWSYHDVILAKQIGLLHDIGRFDEWTFYKKYGGNKFDHGNHGVEVLKKNNYIDKYNINPYDKKVLYQAIYFHNKYDVPIKYNNKHVKLIRDADKIDILYLQTIDEGLYTFNDNFSNTISNKIHKDFYKEKSIKFADISCYGEYVILVLAFIYDLNYDYSLKYIKEKKYLEKFYERLEHKEIYDGYFKKIFQYIEKRIGNVR